MKQVYVKFGERNIPVSIPTPANVVDSEWEMLRQVMKEKAREDLDLQTRLDNCVIFFQRIRTKKNGNLIYVDVNEVREDIDDDDELMLVFQKEVKVTADGSSRNPLSLGNIFVDLNNSDPLNDISDINDLIVDDFNLNVSSIITAPTLTVSEGDQLATGTTAGAASVPHLEQLLASLKKPKSKPASNSATGKSKDLQPKKRPRVLSKSTNHFKKPKLGEFIELPKLTDTLQDGCSKGLALALQSKIMTVYGLFLKTQTDDNPSKSDYDLVGRAIVNRHPEYLNTDDDFIRSHGAVCKSLSTYVRNNKRQVVNALRTAEESSIIEPELLALPDVTDQIQPLQNNLEKEKSDAVLEQPTKSIVTVDKINQLPLALSAYETMYAKLKPIAHLGCTVQVEMLMRETFGHRRSYLESANISGVAAVLEMFNFLRHPDLILFEMSLRVETSVDHLRLKMTECLQHLSGYLNMPAQSEKDKIDLVLCLYEKLKPQNAGKKGLPVLSVVQAGGQALKNELKSDTDDGPRLVLFLRDSLIVSAFITADKKVELKLSLKTAEECLLTLSGANHAWDATFPLAYKALAIFDFHVCQKTLTTSNTKYKFFCKNFTSWIAAQSEKEN